MCINIYIFYTYDLVVSFFCIINNIQENFFRLVKTCARNEKKKQPRAYTINILYHEKHTLRDVFNFFTFISFKNNNNKNKI